MLGVRLVAEPTDDRMEEITVQQPKIPDAPLSDAELLENDMAVADSRHSTLRALADLCTASIR
jgi:hypothetical protein